MFFFLVSFSIILKKFDILVAEKTTFVFSVTIFYLLITKKDVNV